MTFDEPESEELARSKDRIWLAIIAVLTLPWWVGGAVWLFRALRALLSGSQP